jgi:ATP-dependent Clp protease adaptor protein ClpS
MSDPAIPTLEPETTTRPKLLPPYHVLIENDDDHSQLFVVAVLRKVFGYDEPQATHLMHAAEEAGEASGPARRKWPS